MGLRNIPYDLNSLSFINTVLVSQASSSLGSKGFNSALENIKYTMFQGSYPFDYKFHYGSQSQLVFWLENCTSNSRETSTFSVPKWQIKLQLFDLHCFLEHLVSPLWRITTKSNTISWLLLANLNFALWNNFYSNFGYRKCNAFNIS